MTVEPAPIGAPMRRALELAWESACAGSFGIGAVAVDRDGRTLATGRNRILEVDPGDDVIANTSLAHAETNVIAKLRFREHADAGLVLHTTLQPCIQCLGAIRLTPIERVEVLAPDPLWRGIERIADHNEFLARRWPDIVELTVTEWSVFALLLPTHLNAAVTGFVPGWRESLPATSALAVDLADTGELTAAAADGASLDEVAAGLWERLGDCRDEVESLAGR